MLAALTVVASGASAEAVRWTAVNQDEVRRINSDLSPNVPTADIAIYFPANLDPAFVAGFSLAGLLEQVVRAKEIFGAVGVQLNLLWVKTGKIDPSFFEIQANDLAPATPAGKYTNLYIDSRRQGSGLSGEALAAFESIVEKDKGNDRTVYLVVLQDVFMSFYEKLDERTWDARTITTGGLSFPSYSYDDIPRRLRGVITINKNDPLRRVVAHELGHKLMNVSHEYKEVDPQHEVRAEGGLMLYGAGVDIPSGKEGRWHKERLHLSPYLYRQSESGARTWNPDYREGGHYYDPIYGDYVVRFTPEIASATQ